MSSEELYLCEQLAGQEPPYERLLGDAMAGDGALFTREDAVEAAWAVVDPVLKKHHRAIKLQARHVGAEGGRQRCWGRVGVWHNPGADTIVRD